MSNVSLNPHASFHIPSTHPTEPLHAPQAPHAPEQPHPHPPASFTTDGFEPDPHHGPHHGVELLGGPQGEMLVAGKLPSEQNVFERVTGFFKGLGLGAAEVIQSLGQFARNVNDVNPLLIVTGTLADFIVAPIKGRSPGQVLQARSERTQQAGRALLQQTNAMMKLASDLSPGGQRDNFFKMSKALAADLMALRDRGQLTPGRVMEAVQRRTHQNPSVKAAQSLVDSVTNYKAILSSGGSPEEIGKGAFRIFSALAPFAKAKVAGRPPPAGTTAPVRPHGIAPIVSQPKPSTAAGFRGTIARVPNNPVGQAYVRAYEMAKQMASKQGGTVQGIGGSIAEGRGRLATFDRRVWTYENAQVLDKMPMGTDVVLTPKMEAIVRNLPPGSAEAKLAGGRTIPSDMDVVVNNLPYAQQKLIKAEVFERTGVLIEFVRPSVDKLPARGIGH